MSIESGCLSFSPMAKLMPVKQRNRINMLLTIFFTGASLAWLPVQLVITRAIEPRAAYWSFGLFAQAKNRQKYSIFFIFVIFFELT